MQAPRDAKRLAGIAAAQLAGEDFLAGLDRQRADAAGQQITLVPGLSSITAAGLARRISAPLVRAVTTTGQGWLLGHRGSWRIILICHMKGLT